MSTRVAVAASWTLASVALLLIPGQDLPTPDLPFEPDKLVHALLFAGFGLAWTWATPRRAWMVALVGLALGIGTEVAQAMLPINRSGDPLDLLADVVGLAIGVWIGGRRAH